MATDTQGTIWINNVPPKGFNPAANLQSAWNKLAEGKQLLWNKEYAVESLWHEVTHNMQTIAALGRGDTVKKRMVEIFTQWTARRTYPDFLKALGGKAAHLDSIKSEGLGYGSRIKRFGRLLSKLKIDEQTMLAEMQRLLDTVPRDTYQKELTAFLAKRSGQKKGIVSNALSRAKKGGWQFEELLEKFGQDE
jgi:hypothetical protein